MTTLRTFLITFAMLFISNCANAGDIMIENAYARSNGKMAKAGAAFMVIHNHTNIDDRLIAANSVAAKMVQLHRHIKSDDGVMKMEHVPDGFVVPANGSHKLSRGRDHVMFMGLTTPWENGQIIPLTLVFKNAGEMDIRLTVDLKRKDEDKVHKH